ncbi:MAG: hypothetical protein HYW05_00125 [Candidatus Diapherotrites archaeon]|nr:hypothetical protein [Candidatus Diapherotrites archaeon]
MQSMLNFGKSEKGKILALLRAFPRIETKTEFEEFRCKIGNSVATLYRTGKLTIQGTDHEDVKQRLLSGLGLSEELTLGIDEVGRGERTGPFVMAALLGDANKLRELRDSKKTSDIKGKFGLASANSLATMVFMVNSNYIDRLREKGKTLDEIECEFIKGSRLILDGLGEKVQIKVDGNALKPCPGGITFIPKGDDLEPAIGAASVVAKHLREISGDKNERKTWNKKEGSK